MDKNKKVALVHDFLNQSGGAEKVLEALAEMFPEAPIYTLLYDKEKMQGKFATRTIHTSYLQKFPGFLRRNPKWLLLFFPVAPETFDLREFDLVISSSGAWSKGIVTRLNTVHIAYIHSPMRFVWDYSDNYLKDEQYESWRFLIRPFLSYLRLWDKLASDRPDYLIANSKYTAARIAKYYRRESQVIYPPVNVLNDEIVQDVANDVNEKKSSLEIDSKFKIPASTRGSDRSSTRGWQNSKFFLIVSRLSAYKQIDKAVEAFNLLGLPLMVVGTGKQEKYLRSIAKENVKIMGYVSDEKMVEIYAAARAFIFPGVDDFGIAPAEAQAQGIPVLAVRRGGVQEIVEEGKTGEFFASATPEAIAATVKSFVAKEGSYDREYIAQSVERFSKERFKREMEKYIDKVINKEVEF